MTDSSQRIDLLRAGYTQSLPSKYSALEGAWHEFATAPDSATLRELHVLVHRLAGSAPAYGYEQLGDLARAADALLADWDDQPAATGDRIDMLAQRLARPMRALLDALEQAASGRAGPAPAS